MRLAASNTLAELACEEVPHTVGWISPISSEQYDRREATA